MAPGRAVCGSSCTGFVPSRAPRWLREQRSGCQDLRTYVVDFTTATPFELLLQGLPAVSKRQHDLEVTNHRRRLRRRVRLWGHFGIGEYWVVPDGFLQLLFFCCRQYHYEYWFWLSLLFVSRRFSCSHVSFPSPASFGQGKRCPNFLWKFWERADADTRNARLSTFQRSHHISYQLHIGAVIFSHFSPRQNFSFSACRIERFLCPLQMRVGCRISWRTLRLCLTQRVLRDCGILTMINMVWVGNCEICNGVCAWRLPSASSVDWYSSLEEDPVAHLVVLPNYQEDEATSRGARENLRRARSGEKHKRIVLTMEGFEGPNSQDKAERFMAV